MVRMGLSTLNINTLLQTEEYNYSYQYRY